MIQRKPKQIWNARFPSGSTFIWLHKSTDIDMVICAVPSSHTDTKIGTLPCTPLFSSACPHLPPTGLCVNVAGVAQRCLADQVCDKQADWGGREDGLQRPSKYTTWQLMLFMPLSLCACLWAWRVLKETPCRDFFRSWIRDEGQTAPGFVNRFG